ncbi:MAG: hypothetical protein AB7T49_16780 [Oligoflexales bacterium]
MAFLKTILAVTMVLLSSSSFAEDQVSVIVNGQSYQCSGGTSGGGSVLVRYYQYSDCSTLVFSTNFSGSDIDSYCASVAGSASSILSVKINGICEGIGGGTAIAAERACKMFAR